MNIIFFHSKHADLAALSVEWLFKVLLKDGQRTKQHSWTKFSWFNAGYFVVMIASVLLYDFLGGAWLILPLAWLIERACHGLWHLWWAQHFREYSPGLLTSILIWMNLYFVLRYRPEAPPLTASIVIPGLVIGLGFTLFLSQYIPLIKGHAKPHRNL